MKIEWFQNINLGYCRTKSGEKEYCSVAFLDVQQAFDRVGLKGLLYKIKNNRISQVQLHDARSSLFSWQAGVPQGSVLGPVLYNIVTSDLPQVSNVAVAIYADDVPGL